MPEPITLAVVATAVLTEGIKFLYGQAAEALKRRLERKDAAAKDRLELETKPPPGIFSGTLAALEVHVEQLDLLEPQLRKLRQALADIADGLEPLDPNNTEILSAADALRQAMEAVFQQRLTFVGEKRPPSGPVVEGTLDIKQIAGTAAAVEARLIASGKVTGKVTSDRVDSDAVVHGVKVDTIGGKGS
jgi:hypothetical protein